MLFFNDRTITGVLAIHILGQTDHVLLHAETLLLEGDVIAHAE